MKKVVLVLVIGLGGLIGYNYVSTGELTIVPGGSLSAEERELRDLEKQFAATRETVSQAHRASATSGIDMTADVESARRSLRRLQDALGELRKRLTSEAAKQDAERLAQAMRDYSQEIR